MTTEMSNKKCWGIIPIGPIKKKPEIALTKVHAKTEIVNLCTRGTVTQWYKNHGKSAIEVKYVFPLEASAAVCGFEAKIGGKTIVGKIEGREEAKTTYTKAVQSGKVSALLEKDTDNENAFVCNIGNLLPDEECIVKITYVSELDSEGESTRFTLPTAVTSSHIPWTPPPQKIEPSAKVPPPLTQAQIARMSEAELIAYMTKQSLAQQKIDTQKRTKKVEQQKDARAVSHGISGDSKLPYELTFVADIRMPGGIEKISCPSQKFKTIYDKKDRKIIKLETKERLTKEVVVLVNQTDPYATRILVEDFDSKEGSFVPPSLKEKSADQKSDPAESRVMQISFNREFVDPDTDMYCEIVFLVDVSGSMSGNRIKNTKETLQVFLNSLPTNCLFNILPFNRSYKSLFNNSKPYNDKTMRQAQQFVDQLVARGGTNILSPLDFVLSKDPIPGYPRQIFLLTDGEVSNTSSIIRLAQESAGTTRIFTFGIGASASVELCKGVASRTRGTCEMVRNTEDITDQVMRVITSALQPPLCQSKIDWSQVKGGKGGSKQVPAVPPPVYPGRQFVYATNLDTKDLKAGKITVESSMNKDEEKIELEIPTSCIKGTLLHTLAARSRIRELEEKSGGLSTADKKEIRNLGLKYNLASSQTSFVAVLDEDSKEKERKEAATSRTPVIVPGTTTDASVLEKGSVVSRSNRRRGSGGKKKKAKPKRYSSAVNHSRAMPRRSAALAPAGIPSQQTESLSFTKKSKKSSFFGGLFGSGLFASSKEAEERKAQPITRERVEKSDEKSEALDDCLASVPAADCFASAMPAAAPQSFHNAAPAPAPSTFGGPLTHLSAAMNDSEECDDSDGDFGISLESKSVTPTGEEAYKAILKLQKFDGSWTLSHLLLNIIGMEKKAILSASATYIKSSGLDIKKDEELVIATLLALALLQVRYASHKGACMLLSAKARKFVAKRCKLKTNDVKPLEMGLWKAVGAKA